MAVDAKLRPHSGTYVSAIATEGRNAEAEQGRFEGVRISESKQATKARGNEVIDVGKLQMELSEAVETIGKHKSERDK